MTQDKIWNAYRYYRQRGSRATLALEYARRDVATNMFRYPGQQFYVNPRNDKNMAWVESVSQGFRKVGFADELARIDHRGWYTDEDGIGDVLRGIVYQLPARDGKEQYVYGYDDPNNKDCAYLCFDIVDDKIAAARNADHIAEKYAEEEREYQSAWRDGQEYSECVDKIKTQRACLIELVQAMRIQRRRGVESLPICNALKTGIRDMLAQLRAAQKRRAELFDNYEHLALPRNHWRVNLAHSFNEGAGEKIIAV